MATDPVCHMDVDETPDTPALVYQGRTYYFCCESCKVEFDRHPDEYVGNEP